MEKQNHWMSIKQAKPCDHVNAHKRNLLNSFCNNRHLYIKHFFLKKKICQKSRERERMFLCQ